VTPSSNPRIPVNLEFFLTNDYHVEKVKKKVVQTCTDGLVGDGTVKIVKSLPKGGLGGERVEYIPEQIYVPKKTGIDAFTQVENDELFNFEREVEPIVQVLITKTIEQSLLELEEEIELRNMQNFKENYMRRKKTKQDLDTQKVVNLEEKKVHELFDKIAELETVQVRNDDLCRKINSKLLATNYLRDLEANVLDCLEARGRYRAPPQDKFKANFMDYITDEIVAFLDEEHQIEGYTKRMFPDVESRLVAKKKARETKVLAQRQESERLREYNRGQQRLVYVYWENASQIRPLVFSVFNSLILEKKFEVVPCNARPSLTSC
jgi:hypothetical protein